MGVRISIEILKYNKKTGLEEFVSIRERVVKDIDSNLVKAVKATVKGCNNYPVVFYNYYHDSQYEPMVDGYFPYILKNNKYEWHVPAETVTVRDFINTHNIEDNGTIYLSQDSIGGGDLDYYLSDIVLWIPFIVDSVGRALTIYEVFKILRPVYHTLIGKDNKMISPDEYEDMLRSRKERTIPELKDNTGVKDERVHACMLSQAGFKKKGKNYILDDRYNNYLDVDEEENLEEASDYDDTFEETIDYESEEYKLFEFREAIDDLNLLLTSLMFQSEYHESACFDVVMKIVDSHISQWDCYLTKGKKLKFIEIRKKAKPEGEDLEKIVYGTQCLNSYISDLCQELDEHTDKSC